MFYWLLTGGGGVLAMLELGANQHHSIIHNREEKNEPNPRIDTRQVLLSVDKRTCRWLH